ncbi:MAG TPA: TonB-dependent receptor [Usitatibacter sp.]|jgi:iron complex outermembrane receptor protein|nr:TonB-dependent receptor [Usitatibacter sp.]
MKMKQKPVAAAVSLALAGAWPAYAQQAPAPETKETVTVTGIRGSIEKSLETKKNADTVTEVVTAEDIGKLPDKNIADAVQRLPGVTTSSASGGEGGFDENDRVSLRGTNPSLTQTLVNGHSIASGDWFVLDQVTLVGRSVSFSLLPSELVSQVIIRKSATADLVEGGVAGAVDIITRRPLQFAKPVTISASVGGVYADLPGKTDPQASGLANWKNDANTLGVMIQGFYEKRHLRRDAQETLGYGTISPTSALATAHPDLANVAYPTLIGSTLFEQERKRKGGMVAIEVKPLNNLSFDFEAFTSRLDATNYNRNWMFWGSRVIGGDALLPSSYTVQNGTLVASTWPNAGSPGHNVAYGVVDNIYRPGAYSETNYYNLDVNWHLNDQVLVTGQIGSTRGKGVTPKQDVFEGDIFNTGASYQMHGIGSPVDVAFPNGNPASFNGVSLDWIFGASPAATNDKEKYGKADVEWLSDRGMLRSVKGGLRYAEHTRDTQQTAQGPNFALDPFNPANLPHWNGETYPGDFANGLGGNFPRNVWQLSPSELERWGDLYSNRDPVTRQFWSGEFSLKEKDSAAYVMANFEGRGWSGNAGLRFVKTREEVTVNVGIPGDVCAVQMPCPQVPGAITTSAFGSFYRNLVAHDYNDVLPSANLRWDLGNNMIGRLAAARTIARPDYSALGGAITADDTTHTGNGGNPDLKPIRSTNFDATWEWYFAPRALVSAGLFYMDLKDYVTFGVHPTTLLNIRTNTFDTYQISSPVNGSGNVKGLELAWYQPLGMGFGFEANYTYADSKEDKNCAAADLFCQNSTDRLVGASKNTYNITGYYENYGFSARLAYTFRSAFFVGLDRSTAEFQDDTGTLAGSLGYQINKRFAVYFDALNINNPTLKYYAANTDQPRAFYKNGRQYYLSLRVAL